MKKAIDDYIRENEDFRQALLKQEGFIKYMTDYIINGGDDGLSLYAKYQDYVFDNYCKANRWNPDTLLLSMDELRLKALNPGNHLKKEFGYRKALERLLSELDEEEAAETIRGLYDGYMAYAWRTDFERHNPQHTTDMGFYQNFMEQFRHPNGLVYCCMELAIKEHHGKGWTETDQYDFYQIAEYHYFYFDLCGPHGNRAFGRLRRGVKEWLEGKDDEECRELAKDMLEKVRFFSHHIYNDEAVCYSNGSPFPIGDKKWLRGLVENSGKNSVTEVMQIFRDFLFLLQEVCRIWAARLLRYHKTDLHEFEKRVYSFLRPYSPNIQRRFRRYKDDFDYFHYLDHYYIEDTPNDCCFSNEDEVRKRIYNLYNIQEDDLSENTDEVAEWSDQEKENTNQSKDERREGDGRLPRVVGGLMWTARAKQCFRKAVEKRWMTFENGKYSWCGVKPKPSGKPNKSELAYFLSKVYGFEYKDGNNCGAKLPAAELNNYFGFNKSVTDTLLQLYRRNNEQPYRSFIDDFFNEIV